jgi:hypothetical protein
MSVLINQICPVIHLRVPPQTASILPVLYVHFCVYPLGQSQPPDPVRPRKDRLFLIKEKPKLCAAPRPAGWTKNRPSATRQAINGRSEHIIYIRSCPHPGRQFNAADLRLSNVMERTVIDWVEELRGLDPVEAAETILSGLGLTRQHDIRTLAYALTAWAVLAKEEEKRVQ